MRDLFFWIQEHDVIGLPEDLKAINRGNSTASISWAQRHISYMLLEDRKRLRGAPESYMGPRS